MKETLVDMFQLGHSPASSRIREVSVWFLKKVAAKISSGGSGDDKMSDCLDRWKKSDKLMKAVVKRIVFSPLLTRPVAGFMKHHVDTIVDKSHNKGLQQVPPQQANGQSSQSQKSLTATNSQKSEGGVGLAGKFRNQEPSTWDVVAV